MSTMQTNISSKLAPDPKIIVALDYADATSAIRLADQLDPDLCRVKVGKELFTASGPAIIEALLKKQFGIFLDLKFHDIPTTVAKACQAASNLGVWMLNVHASGGSAMMQAAREGVDKSSQRSLLIAVSVLTSMDQLGLHEIGVSGKLQDHVIHLARLTKQSGLDGLVCSAMEAIELRDTLGDDFLLVTPGIRPANAASNDQSRVITPALALSFGADYLVIGRPITQAADPLAALKMIHEEITSLSS